VVAFLLLYVSPKVFRNFLSDWRAGGWPTATGTIEEAEVIEPASNRGEFRVRFLYTYSVPDAEYSSERYSFCIGTSFDDRADANELLARYPVTTEVPIAYDPADPAISVLEAGVSGHCVVVVVAFVLAWISVLASAAVLLRRI